MELSAEGIELIKKSEGFRDHVYLDVEGYPTIGYGHRLIHPETFPNGITEAQGTAILYNDKFVRGTAQPVREKRALRRKMLGVNHDNLTIGVSNFVHGRPRAPSHGLKKRPTGSDIIPFWPHPHHHHQSHAAGQISEESIGTIERNLPTKFGLQEFVQHTAAGALPAPILFEPLDSTANKGTEMEAAGRIGNQSIDYR